MNKDTMNKVLDIEKFFKDLHDDAMELSSDDSSEDDSYLLFLRRSINLMADIRLGNAAIVYSNLED